MKCKNCNAIVSIADSHCPQCGNDLLQFEAITFYDPQEREEKRYDKNIKDRILRDFEKEAEEVIGGFDLQDREILQPVEIRLRNLLLRSLSNLEWENTFDNEIIPIIDSLLKDKLNILKKVEAAIKDNLGQIIFNYYENKLEDVLKILRAGEVIHILLKDDTKKLDLSVKMFPFFKASEVACWRHIRNRYQQLKSHPLMKEIAEWMGDDVENIFIEGIPQWIVERKKTWVEIISGIFVENEYHLNGLLRTGISLYFWGRDWVLRIERKDLSKIKEFQIKNILKAKGNDTDKEILIENLFQLQDLRNKRVHTTIEESEKTVQQGRSLSYDCLRKIPLILEI